ncbi:MAG: stage II sporulation protein R [Clostridia bacterium]|nr:stage II sporulation protein R [Clostridia bacterium]
MRYILPILLSSVLLIAFIPKGEAGEVARVHVIANSDSTEDIAIKMKVAEAVTELLKNEKFSDLDSIEKGLSSRISEIEEKAESLLEEEGVSYGASVEVGVRYFDRKALGNSAFPEGDYLALTVTLGKGNGHNWWSVMFPEITLGASLSLGEEGGGGKTVILGDGSIVKIRSLLFDLFHRLAY